ncbi:hypothetical protein ACFO25_05220 [Paenactinomyces guangxiensis]|uniref:Uncharacterized protein n=1 Tax=Paenactinomyces guangxiensis TaxID=1490290 RepID=A0A7W1WPM2_9BACL|nr:hypothetical protein [Paenactinomyces guangxiensis]MBA4493778.1 hypothetical protein [Paenactinomyces guangxiensis]MBH8591067.1 hypothetical protein [Paenactinomyces guangxiensis]
MIQINDKPKKDKESEESQFDLSGDANQVNISEETRDSIPESYSPDKTIKTKAILYLQEFNKTMEAVDLPEEEKQELIALIAEVEKSLNYDHPNHKLLRKMMKKMEQYRSLAEPELIEKFVFTAEYIIGTNFQVIELFSRDTAALSRANPASSATIVERPSFLNSEKASGKGDSLTSSIVLVQIQHLQALLNDPDTPYQCAYNRICINNFINEMIQITNGEVTQLDEETYEIRSKYLGDEAKKVSRLGIALNKKINGSVLISVSHGKYSAEARSNARHLLEKDRENRKQQKEIIPLDAYIRAEAKNIARFLREHEGEWK